MGRILRTDLVGLSGIIGVVGKGSRLIVLKRNDFLG